MQYHQSQKKVKSSKMYLNNNPHKEIQFNSKPAISPQNLKHSKNKRLTKSRASFRKDAFVHYVSQSCRCCGLRFEALRLMFQTWRICVCCDGTCVSSMGCDILRLMRLDDAHGSRHITEPLIEVLKPGPFLGFVIELSRGDGAVKELGF